MARRSLRMAIFIALVLSGNAVMYLNHASSNIFVYSVVSYMFYAIFIAEAFSSLRLRIGIHPRLRGVLSILVLCGLLAFPAALSVRNYPLVDQSENGLDDYFSEVISRLDSNSVVMAPDYHWFELFFYKLNVEGLRKQDDIKLIYQRWKIVDVQEALAADKTVYLFNRIEEVEAIGLIPEVLPAPEAPDLNLLSLHPATSPHFYSYIYRVNPNAQRNAP